MQVFKTFFKLTLRNIASGMIYLFIFLTVALTLTKTAGDSSTQSFKAQKIKIAVFDQDNSKSSRELVSYLNKNQKCISITKDEDKWPDELFYHTIETIVVINNGYEEELTSGNYEKLITTYDNPDTNKSYIVKNQIETYISCIGNLKKAGLDNTDAFSKAAQISKLTVKSSYLDKDKIIKPSAMSYFYTFVPYILLCLMINSLGPVLVIWNRPGIKERTAVSGLSFSKKNAALIGATTLYSLVIYGIFIVVSLIFFKQDAVSTKALYYYLNMLSYMMVCLAFTFLAAQLSKKVPMLSMFANVFGLSTSFLCGVFVMRELLPDGVIAFSRCLPTYWYINVTEELKTSTGGLSTLAISSIFIQLLFAAAIYIIGLVIVRYRREAR